MIDPMAPTSPFGERRSFLSACAAASLTPAAALLSGCAGFTQRGFPHEVVTGLAPTGRLRACINLGNPILARRDGENAPVTGVSVDLAQALARRIGVPLDLLVVSSAGQSVEAVSSEQADVGFFAIDPLRSEGIRFTAAYVLIEGWYLVRQQSPIRRNAEVDRSGIKVMVGKASAYDLFLSRELKAATLVRAPSSPAVVERFIAENADVAAGVKQQLEADAQRLGGLRLLPERFMEIRQAMGLPRGRSAAAAQALSAFVEQMKAEGFIADALKRHGIQGALVAPPAA